MIVLEDSAFKVEGEREKAKVFGYPFFPDHIDTFGLQEEDAKIVPVDSADKSMSQQSQMLLINSSLLNNHLEHVEQVMGFHPTYMLAFLNSQNYLLNDDGPLNFAYRHYIAIMAAARHQCVYLMRLHAHEFLLQGGDPEWLEGLSKVPQKLFNLCEINNILAHRPWLLKKEHIAKLVRGKDQFSLSELMQALVIMAHFHTLCSFIYGCGITAETNHSSCTTRLASSGDESEDYSSDSSGEAGCNGLDEACLQSLMQRMEQMRRESSHEDCPTQEEMRQRFESVENQSAQICVPSADKKMSSRKAEASVFVVDSDFTYLDFGNRASPADNQTFRAQDYSWEDQGISLANGLYGDIGNLLDKRFNVAFTLTYYTMGNNAEVDTSAFRQAIWHYIHCMYGIRHDDYDYGKVNKMLEKGFKSYIKTVTCYPDRLTKKDADSVMRAFKHSEKVHVNLMIAEARMQAELLYALRAINQHLT